MRPCNVLRVFTDGPDGGNHLGVIADVTGLDGPTMQEIATDLGFSETVFLDWNDPAMPVVRIFTPAAELDFAGHPLVGTAWFLATMAPGDLGRLRCGIGEVRFGVDGEMAWIDVDTDPPVQEAEGTGALAEAARLPTHHEAWWVDVPQRYLMLEVTDPDHVIGAAPDFDELRGTPGTYLFARDGDDVRARFFAPALGVDEDPATGSAAVALAALRRFEGEGEGSLSISQGTEVGMPCRIGLSWSADAIRLAGTVVRDEVRMLDA